jgi:hypothetical protein
VREPEEPDALESPSPGDQCLLDPPCRRWEGTAPERDVNYDRLHRHVQATNDLEKTLLHTRVTAHWERVANDLRSETPPGVTIGDDDDVAPSNPCKLPFHLTTPKRFNRRFDDKNRRADAYQWAAEHAIRAGDASLACLFFLDAGFIRTANADQDEENGVQLRRLDERRARAAGLLLEGLKAYAQVHGTLQRSTYLGNYESLGVRPANVADALQRLQHNHGVDVLSRRPRRAPRGSDGLEQQRSQRLEALSAAYYQLSAAVLRGGQEEESIELRRRAQRYLTFSYLSQKKWWRAIALWARGNGFRWVVGSALVFLVLVLPTIYSTCSLLVPPGSDTADSNWIHAFVFNIRTTLASAPDDLRPRPGIGGALEIIQHVGAFFSWA